MAVPSGLGGFSTALQNAGLGSWATKLLTKLNPYVALATSAWDLGKGIASLFQPSVEGRQKLTATANQQDIETRARQIEANVKAGGMDPVTGLRQIDMLIAMVQSTPPGSNEWDQRGLSKALMLLNQVRANLSESVNWKLAEVGDKTGTMGMAGISPDPGFQKEWTRNAMLNKLAGFERGNQQLAGSPLEKLYRPAFDVSGGFASALGQAQQAVPAYKEPASFEELRKKLAGGIQ